MVFETVKVPPRFAVEGVPLAKITLSEVLAAVKSSNVRPNRLEPAATVSVPAAVPSCPGEMAPLMVILPITLPDPLSVWDELMTNGETIAAETSNDPPLRLMVALLEIDPAPTTASVPPVIAVFPE